MINTYKELKRIARSQSLNAEDAVHALMATVYTTCCEHCNEVFHSENFMKAFERMLHEIELCKALGEASEKAVAVAGD